jgi:hypothetical protein
MVGVEFDNIENGRISDCLHSLNGHLTSNTGYFCYTSDLELIEELITPNEFNVGDSVVYIGQEHHAELKNFTGVIRRIAATRNIGVEFDDNADIPGSINLNNLNGTLSGAYGYYCRPENLRIVYDFQVGDKVKIPRTKSVGVPLSQSTSTQQAIRLGFDYLEIHSTGMDIINGRTVRYYEVGRNDLPEDPRYANYLLCDLEKYVEPEEQHTAERSNGNMSWNSVVAVSATDDLESLIGKRLKCGRCEDETHQWRGFAEEPERYEVNTLEFGRKFCRRGKDSDGWVIEVTEHPATSRRGNTPRFFYKAFSPSCWSAETEARNTAEAEAEAARAAAQAEMERRRAEEEERRRAREEAARVQMAAEEERRRQEAERRRIAEEERRSREEKFVGEITKFGIWYHHKNGGI